MARWKELMGHCWRVTYLITGGFNAIADSYMWPNFTGATKSRLDFFFLPFILLNVLQYTVRSRQKKQNNILAEKHRWESHHVCLVCEELQANAKHYEITYLKDLQAVKTTKAIKMQITSNKNKNAFCCSISWLCPDVQDAKEQTTTQITNTALLTDGSRW